MFRSLILLLISYIAAAPLTSLISFDLSLTAWTNIWTYVIWFGSIPFWFFVFLFVMAILGGIANKGG